MAIHSIRKTPYPTAEDSFKKREPTHGDFSAALTAARTKNRESLPPAETYVVRSGDTLSQICQHLKTSFALPQSLTDLVREMTSLNKLADPDRISAGQVLHLPASGQGNTSAGGASIVPVIPVMQTPTAPADPLKEDESTAGPQTAGQQPDFPLFAQRGTIVLPSEIPPFYFPRQDFPAPVIPPPVVSAITTASDTATPKDSITTRPPLIRLSPKHDLQTQIAMYKEDQLLAHPGGDYYFLNRTTEINDPSFDQSEFGNRVGKDLADTGENLLNIAKDLAMGAPFKYVTDGGEVKSSQRVGLLGTLKHFVEDVFSGLSFGAYVPDGEKAPQGAGASIGHFLKKIVYDAPIKDLLIGIPHAAVNIVKDTALASLNLLETIPDATIGNFQWGQKATTTVFDNGQVAIDYLTDILPGGDAWLRVHAAGAQGDIEPPVYFNLITAEQGITDSRWSAVRNTPFRKTIETIGSLLSDAVLVGITTHTFSPSSDQRHD